MQSRQSPFLRTAITLAAIAYSVPSANAQNGVMAPNYSRTRTGADDWHARGGGNGWVHGNGSYGNGYNYYQPYYSPVIAGSWYARPYPYHLDYYRYRWGGAAQTPAPLEDCPCATDASTPEVSPAPG